MSEANSFIRLDQLDALKFLPAIKRDDVENPLVSPELAEQIFMPAGDTLDNLPIRGVLPVSTQIHEKVRMIAGRMFRPGLNEGHHRQIDLESIPRLFIGCGPESWPAHLESGWCFRVRGEFRLSRRFGPIYIACRRIRGEARVSAASVSSCSRRGCSVADSAMC